MFRRFDKVLSSLQCSPNCGHNILESQWSLCTLFDSSPWQAFLSVIFCAPATTLVETTAALTPSAMIFQAHLFRNLVLSCYSTVLVPYLVSTESGRRVWIFSNSPPFVGGFYWNFYCLTLSFWLKPQAVRDPGHILTLVLPAFLYLLHPFLFISSSEEALFFSLELELPFFTSSSLSIYVHIKLCFLGRPGLIYDEDIY